ncbi:hypothetical protein QAC_14 [Pseudomonas phage QAC]|jgi:hypothetical protein|uniref:Uncharacterized protein n=3 Tax=Ghunavirus TaxID=2732683 RepID=A0AAE8AVE9_9CAUD|nr:hypothetical protein FRS_14 [Pseudomonas phage FRS]UAV89838.1 hypothetical protein QAC_14 [Pseudomonas phage QAC]
MTHPVLLHSNRGTGHFTVRQDREIVKWLGKVPFHAVLRNPIGQTFLVTKGTFAQSRKLGRVVLIQYTGKFPRCALVWKIVKEVFA